MTYDYSSRILPLPNEERDLKKKDLLGCWFAQKLFSTVFTLFNGMIPSTFCKIINAQYYTDSHQITKVIYVMFHPEKPVFKL